MDTIEQVKQVAFSHFRGVLNMSCVQDGCFKALVAVEVGDTVKPLLLVGNAHNEEEDGHCIAVLNPDKALVDTISAGCAYGARTLKEIVAKRCDVALDLWIENYMPADRAVTVSMRYKTHHFQPAKFAVS
ncbi:MAG: hypothetical protein KF853_13565 [Rhodocyclaceae bacterium]|nr:hypothetical protein [Rhodocyclaceae bacterium]